MRSNGVFIGDGSLLIRCAEIYLSAGNSIAGVASDDQQVRDWANQRQLKIIDGEFDCAVAGLGQPYDFLFSIANYKIVSGDAIARARRMAINFHDSLLPRYAGYYATSWALMSGEHAHGVTWHEMAKKVDSGRILRQSSFPILDDETAFSLNAKCYEAGVATFEEIVSDIDAGRLETVEQTGERSYFGRDKRPPRGAVLDFWRPAEESERLVRALDFGPYPNPLGRAKLWTGGDLVVVKSAEVLDSSVSAPPGTVLSVCADAVCVATPTGSLQLLNFSTLDRASVSSPAMLGLEPGSILPRLEAEGDRKLINSIEGAARSEAFWIDRLRNAASVELPYPRRPNPIGEPAVPVRRAWTNLGAERNEAQLGDGGKAAAAGFMGWISRLVGQSSVWLSYSDPIVCSAIEYPKPWFAERVGISFKSDGSELPRQLITTMSAEIDQVRQAGPYLADLPSRLSGERRGGEQRRI